MSNAQPSDVVLYASWELRSRRLNSSYFTVNIPFVCQKCGKCCESYLIRSYSQEIIDYLGVTEDYIVDLLTLKTSEDGELITPERCSFLVNQMCSIYPVRPNDCRTYFGHGRFLDKSGNPVCPARRRQEEISDCMKKWYPIWSGWYEHILIDNGHFELSKAAVSSIDDIKKEHLRPYFAPTRRQWNEIWRRFQTMNPTEEETRLFLILNPVCKIYGGTET